MTQGSPAEEQQ
jgi:hypothetical protein